MISIININIMLYHTSQYEYWNFFLKYFICNHKDIYMIRTNNYLYVLKPRQKSYFLLEFVIDHFKFNLLIIFLNIYPINIWILKDLDWQFQIWLDLKILYNCSSINVNCNFNLDTNDLVPQYIPNILWYHIYYNVED